MLNQDTLLPQPLPCHIYVFIDKFSCFIAFPAACKHCCTLAHVVHSNMLPDKLRGTEFSLHRHKLIRGISDKIYPVSFTKFLYSRFIFFTSIDAIMSISEISICSFKRLCLIALSIFSNAVSLLHPIPSTNCVGFK